MCVIKLLSVKLVSSINARHLYNAKCPQITNKNERLSQYESIIKNIYIYKYIKNRKESEQVIAWNQKMYRLILLTTGVKGKT